MSDQEDDKELAEMRQQIEQAAEASKSQAATAVEEQPAPSPEPPASPAPEPVAPEPTPTAPSTPAKAEDDPLKWAEKKGFKTPDDMARALLQKDREFHESRQKAAAATPPQPQAPAWEPRPDMNGYGYPPAPAYGYPPPVPRGDAHREIAAHYNLHPDDVRAFAPLVADLAENVTNRRTAALEKEIFDLRRSTARNNELMTLMQDPVFKDERVQREIHAILDSDPTIFQGPQAYTVAYHQALANMARKQLQQGMGEGNTHNRGTTPPVTAGGGNGSADTLPRLITEREFDSWTDAEQKAFIESKGTKVPKR